MNLPSASPVVLDPLWPLPVIGLLGVAAFGFTVWAYHRLGTDQSWARRATLLTFRCLGISALLLVLLQPSRHEPLPPPDRDRVTLVAVDTSKSMLQADVNGATRIDTSRRVLRESGMVKAGGEPTDGRLRLFEFAEDARPVAASVFELKPQGRSTRIHQSVSTILGSLAPGTAANALVLLTDGHDFELVNAAKTALAARARKVPVYAVALGRQGSVRDVAVRITSWQPYVFVKQQARIAASLRLIGCEFEEIPVELVRAGKVVQTRRVSTTEATEVAVEFTVNEPATGQFEYEIRVPALTGEVDAANNAALTCLNVIDQQLRVLLLEGEPYWDTTFLQRSLMRNDKIDVDSIVRYAAKSVRPLRKKPDAGPLAVPRTVAEFARYDVVVLGRGVDGLLGPPQIQALTEFVEHGGGTVIFGRGPAFGKAARGNELEPVLWGRPQAGPVRLTPGSDGPLRSMARNSTALEELPAVISAREPGELKPLTAPLANAGPASGTGRDDVQPVMVHRRYGRGQVVSIGVEGLWRWAFHPRVEVANNGFDRFWDQLMVWLSASREILPSRPYTLQISPVNVPLGDKVFFRLNEREPNTSLATLPLQVQAGDREVARVMLGRAPGEGRLAADFMPETLGRHRVAATLPDGTRAEGRFIVYSENAEETEVATDIGYLQRLCAATGGRLLTAAELPKLMTELRTEPEPAARSTRLVSLWDQAWCFWLTIGAFAGDWYLRRRWGLS